MGYVVYLKDAGSDSEAIQNGLGKENIDVFSDLANPDPLNRPGVCVTADARVAAQAACQGMPVVHVGEGGDFLNTTFRAKTSANVVEAVRKLQNLQKLAL